MAKKKQRLYQGVAGWRMGVRDGSKGDDIGGGANTQGLPCGNKTGNIEGADGKK